MREVGLVRFGAGIVEMEGLGREMQAMVDCHRGLTQAQAQAQAVQLILFLSSFSWVVKKPACGRGSKSPRLADKNQVSGYGLDWAWPTMNLRLWGPS